MKIIALLMHETDNVVTCIEGAKKGDEVVYHKANQMYSITPTEDIPPCHKIAIIKIKKNDCILKYGETIGAAQQDFLVGSWVSHLNICSIPRDYTNEML